MPTLADMLQVPSEITHKGVTLKVRPPTQVNQGVFSRWLEKRAREFVERSEDLDEIARQRLMRGICADAAAGAFEWGSDAYVQSLGTPIGVAKMLLIVLRDANGGSAVNLPDGGIQEISEEFVTEIVAQKVAEIAAILQAAEVEDPLAKAAVLASVGLPPNFVNSKETSSNPSASNSPPPTPPSKE